MKTLLIVALVSCSLTALADKKVDAKTKPAPAAVQADEPDELDSEAADDANFAKDQPIPEGMKLGPAKVTMGSNASLNVPDESEFGNAKVARDTMKQWGNLISNKEVGILFSPNGSSILFEFDPVGLVKDDDKESLDADKVLASLKENQEEANTELKESGGNPLEIVGWQVKPHYDEATHNLESAPLIRDIASGKESVNYNVKILGRRGVMEVALLVSPEKFDQELKWFRSTMKGFNFVQGEDYSSWIKGDKVAEYGLGALAVGGGVAVLAKTGILAKLIKPILGALAAAAMGIKRFFSGSKNETSVVKSDQERES
jgi:uncharacterized membrane-anchored protein